MFDSYQLALLNTSHIQGIDGKQVSYLNYTVILESTKEIGLTNITTSENTYVLTKELILKQGYKEAMDQGYVVVYENSPAINQELSGAIIKIDGKEITSLKSMQKEIAMHKPGDKIVISAIINESIKDYEIVLGENPDNKTEPWLGIGIIGTIQKPTAKFFQS